ncbi:MAG: polysaccharide biosynthesis tyrosine autokinase [Verrucomicrobia bacterium]|nr:polysaccharide biosynthesis tyrosine autokinase [Verrucomicrobiota bacterium]
MDKNFKAPVETEVKLHFLDYWRIIRIRKTVILAVFLLVVLTTTLVTYMLPKFYQSSVRIQVEKDVSDVTPFGGMNTSSSFDPYFIQTQFELINSKEVLNKVIEAKSLNSRWAAKYGTEGQPLKTSQTYTFLKRNIELRQTRNTSLIEIRVSNEIKEEAAELANAVAEQYSHWRLTNELARASSGILALEAELKIKNEELGLLQDKVDTMRKEKNIAGDPPEGGGGATMEPETVRKLENIKIESESMYTRLNTLYLELTALSRPELEKTLPTANPDTLLNDLLLKQASAEQSLVQLEKELTEENIEVKKARAYLAEIRRQIDNRLDGVLRGIKSMVAAAQAQFKQADEMLEKAKRTDIDRAHELSDYFKTRRQLETQKRMRDALGMKITQEKIDVKIPRSAVVMVIDKAEPGVRPVRPNIPLNIALGVIVGLLVGVGLAFFIEYLDTSVKTIDDVERTLQAPVLGVIPQNVGSLLAEGPESPHAESYRVLRTNILFTRKDDALKTITVVSGGAGEGKSTTLFNLATVFAQNGQRVLIVDSDLRRPSIHKFLHVTNAVGLTNYLLKQNRLEEVIQTTPLATLDFMPSGKLPSSSMGVLNSVAMKEMVQELKRRYDFVFFDSPPIMGVSDAAILASEVDLALQVIQYRKYPQAMTIRAKQMVEKVGGNLIGVVLNNINMSQDENYYYYSGYYYDYYSKQDDDESGKKNGQSKKAGVEPQNRIDLKPKY